MTAIHRAAVRAVAVDLRAVVVDLRVVAADLRAVAAGLRAAADLRAVVADLLAIQALAILEMPRTSVTPASLRTAEILDRIPARKG